MRAVSVGLGGSGLSDDLLKRSSRGAFGFKSASLENYFQLIGHTVRKKWRTSEDALGALAPQRTKFVAGGWESSGNMEPVCSL